MKTILTLPEIWSAFHLPVGMPVEIEQAVPVSKNNSIEKNESFPYIGGKYFYLERDTDGKLSSDFSYWDNDSTDNERIATYGAFDSRLAADKKAYELNTL